jgi:hypothetical protein
MRITRTLALCLAASACVPTAAPAQLGNGNSPTQATTSGRQEVAPLLRSGIAGGPFTLWGGRYLLTQACANYNSGSLSVSIVGPAGQGTIPVATKTASDSAGGTEIAIGSNAVVSATAPSGSTGCNADLSRIP